MQRKRENTDIFIDDFDREIKVGTIIVYSYGWSSGIYVIRGFGRSGHPLLVSVKLYHDNTYDRFETWITGSRYNVFKLEDDWLRTYPDQPFVGELMRLQYELLSGTYKKS